MSTWAAIVRENLDGSFDSILLSQDGDPCSAGVTLFKYYPTLDLVNTLLSYGQVVQLGRQIGMKHAPKLVGGPVQWCLFQSRDGGGRPQIHHHEPCSHKELLRHFKGRGCEYVYLFSEVTNAWYAVDIIGYQGDRSFDSAIVNLITIRTYINEYLETHFDHPSTVPQLIQSEGESLPDLTEQFWLNPDLLWRDTAPDRLASDYAYDYENEEDENEHTDPIVVSETDCSLAVGQVQEAFQIEIFNYDQDGDLSYTITLWRLGKAAAQYEVENSHIALNLDRAKQEVEDFLLRLSVGKETIDDMFNFEGF